jgi:hypothetical protein
VSAREQARTPWEQWERAAEREERAALRVADWLDLAWQETGTLASTGIDPIDAKIAALLTAYREASKARERAAARAFPGRTRPAP